MTVKYEWLIYNSARHFITRDRATGNYIGTFEMTQVWASEDETGLVEYSPPFTTQLVAKYATYEGVIAKLQEEVTIRLEHLEGDFRNSVGTLTFEGWTKKVPDLSLVAEFNEMKEGLEEAEE